MLERPCIASPITSPSWVQFSSYPCHVENHLGRGSFSPSCSNSQSSKPRPQILWIREELCLFRIPDLPHNKMAVVYATKFWGGLSCSKRSPGQGVKMLLLRSWVALEQWSSIGWLCPPGDIWQCLQTFLVITALGEIATGIWWAEYSDGAKHSTMHKSPWQQEIIWPKISIVPRLRNPALEKRVWYRGLLMKRLACFLWWSPRWYVLPRHTV